jgi:hypothetical protein
VRQAQGARIASDRDLVNCYKSLRKLNKDCEKLRAQLKELEEAALPIARLLVPHPGGVTTPPEIIPYYRLNHSIWSLSDNKETSC